MHGRNLHDWLTKEFKILKWEHKIGIVSDIIDGLKQIHKQNIIHRNLHSGNVLQSYRYSHIADLGLSYQSLTSNKNNTYGVLPYIAPEILNGEPYTTASDIYSFGILMSLVSTGQQPFYNIAHDENLAFKICVGMRPTFSINTPKLYVELAYKCMDANPNNRPTAEEICEIIWFWNYTAVKKEFEEMDKIEFDPSTITETVHLNAIYTSRLLKLTNLPLPVNSRKVMIIGNNNSNYFCLIIE